MSEIAEVHRRRRDVRARRRFERGDDGGPLRIDADLVVKTLHQLPARREPPGELHEGFLHLVRARKLRFGARLAVVIAKPLVSAEEPQPIANSRTTDVAGEVLVLRAAVRALL